MKKIINCKKTIQKILIVIILIVTFNFIMPTYSQADFGGVLMKPITDLFCNLGDAVCAALQYFLVDGDAVNSAGDAIDTAASGLSSLLSGFLISSDEYNSNMDDYSEIEYNDDTGATKYVFYTDDIDLEGWDWLASLTGESVAIPVTKYTPEAIFSGQVPALDINFITPKTWDTEEENNRSVANDLHEMIAKWYVALRNLAIVGLMVILVYVGIRMVISSTATDKAKYKQLMLDWLVAMCLLFCLHYIMSFTITITQEITNAISGSVSTTNTIPITVYEGGSDSSTELVKFNTSLTGLARFQTRMDDGGTRLIYTIIYIALVIYTCMFTLTYLKRVITMAFLTLISPLVALTYPLDKMSDGKAQAFNMWLKEYIFNALLQPFHLIIYTIFVGSAIGLASKNPIYAIIALAFITPAEKILRRFFGFDKAPTAGGLNTFANMAGGAAAYKMISNAINKRQGNKNGKDGGKGVRTSNNQRALNDPDAPSGVDGFTGHNDGALEGESDGSALESGNGTAPLEGGNNERGNDTNSSIPAGYQSTSSGILIPSPDPRRNTTAQQSTAEVTPEPETEALDSGATQDGDEARRSNRIVEGFRGSGRAIKNRAKSTIGNKEWLKYTGKKLAKSAGKGAVHLAARGYTTVGIGALGLAAGIAGDDLEDVLKFGAGGAVLGATAGGNIAVNAVDDVGRGVVNSSAVQGFIQGYTDQNAMERQLERQIETDTFSKDFQQEVNETYGDGDLSGQELIDASRRAATLKSYGITDSSKRAKTMKLENSILEGLADSDMSDEDKQKLARQQAVTAQKMADKIPDEKLSDPKWVENRTKQITAQIKTKNPQLSDNEAKKNANTMMDMIFKYKKISRA